MPFYAFLCPKCDAEKKIFSPPGDLRPVNCSKCGEEMKRQYDSFYAFGKKESDSSRKNIEKAVEDNRDALKQTKQKLQQKAKKGMDK